MKLDNRLENTSLYPFLNQLIDYAGMFPPTSLTLEEAIHNYASYQSVKDSWMLGPFVIQASRLNELDPYITLFSKERPLTISAVGTRSSSLKEHSEVFYNDLKEMDQFRKRHDQLVRITTLELPLPPTAPDINLLNTISKEIGKRGLQAYCEVPELLNRDWKENILNCLDAIATHNSKNPVTLGFKLRTGGVTADAFPSPRQVAVAIKGCRDRQIAMKFTAGLHHPIRMYRKEINKKMHGFINVFVAGMLDQLHHLELETIEKIIAEEKASSFTFNEGEITWSGLRISNDEIQHFRTLSLRSFGCCSFNDPRDDMRALKFL